MSNGVPADLPPASAEDHATALVPVSREASSLAVRPEAALALATHTLALATREVKAKWEREREAQFARHVALQESGHDQCAEITSKVEALTRGTSEVCVACYTPTTNGKTFCSHKCASTLAETTNVRLHKASTDVYEAIDREVRTREARARAEIHAVEVQALQQLDRATLRAALNASYHEYHAALDQCPAYDLRLLRLRVKQPHTLFLIGERPAQVLKAREKMHLLEEAWNVFLGRERDERVGRMGGAPRRHCQVCLLWVIEESPWCSTQCQRVDEAGKTYVASYVPGLFRCEWCRRYFWVPDPDRANIHDAAAFCSRACLNALPVDLDEHADMDFSTVKILPPPPPTIAARQRGMANYLQRVIEDLDRRESRHDAALTPSRPIEVAGAREAPAVPGHPDILGCVRTLLLKLLGPEISLTVRPGDLVDDLRRRLDTEISPEVVGGWLRKLGAQQLPKDRRGARYQLSQDHLRS